MGDIRATNGCIHQFYHNSHNFAPLKQISTHYAPVNFPHSKARKKKTGDRRPYKKPQLSPVPGAEIGGLFQDFDGVDRASVGGVEDPGISALGLGMDGGGRAGDMEDFWGGVGAHTAGNAPSAVDLDLHEKNLLYWDCDAFIIAFFGASGKKFAAVHKISIYFPENLCYSG